MPTEVSALLKLQEAFFALPEGPVETSSSRIPSLLSTAWAELDGGDATNMKGEKLGRIENLVRTGETLVFKIERHGGTVNGSSRAELHTWVVDVSHVA